MALPFAEKLLENIRRFAKTEGEQLPPGLSQAQVVARMREGARSNHVLMEETNALITAHLDPVFKNPHALSDADAYDYAALAMALFTPPENLDQGLAYSLHHALLRRARRLHDVDRTVFHLYYCGLIHLRWSDTRFADKAGHYFTEAVSYLPDYTRIQSKQTRLYLNRCLGNVYVSIMGRRLRDSDYTLFFEAIDTARRFWRDPEIRALDPDFPWEAFLQNTHQNTCAWLDVLRGPGADDAYLAQRVYESAKALYGDEGFFLSNDLFTWPNTRTMYTVSAAKYHMGLLSAEAFSEEMRRIFDAASDDDYSEEGIYRMMTVPTYMIEYMRRIPGISPQALHAEEARVLGRIFEYCRHMPSHANRALTNFSVSLSLPNYLQAHVFPYAIELLLKMTTFSHLPTHVHSIMTSRLMRVLAEYFMEHAPGRLVGVCGTQTERQVLETREEILDTIALAGMAHDAGKIIFIQTVSLCSRKLTDVEFEIIKQHPAAGCEMIQSLAQQERCIADVIGGHHKWHDGSRGYPQDFDNTKSPVRFVIDLAAVADSMDAATDSIGRAYAFQATFDKIVKEIQEQAGTRYSPAVAAALDNPAVSDRLRYIIEHERESVYFEVYQSMLSPEVPPLGAAEQS